jgi:hypothetical protein
MNDYAARLEGLHGLHRLHGYMVTKGNGMAVQCNDATKQPCNHSARLS